MPWRELDGAGPWRRWPLVVLFAGLVVTIAGVALTARMYRDSEERLLDQQTREAGAVLAAAVGRTETALADAAVLADATDGDPAKFAGLATAMAERSGFVGAEVLTVAADSPEVVSDGGGALIGPTELPGAVTDLIDEAVAEPGTIRVALLEGSARRLGYATTSNADTPFVVYAETALPDRPTLLGRSDGPFSDIDYGIYLGDAETRDTLLYTSVDDVPLDGAKSVITLPFADRSITFASTAAKPLAGRFAQAAPWILAAGGTVVSILAALGTRSVLRRGRAAELLAARLAQLSAQQRAGIDTLRSSLLPRRLDAPPGVDLHTGYWPADQDHEISGDFYDAFRVDDRRWALVIGDVCGKGPDAAALTGLTRHTIRAAARHLRSPADVLRWTHEAIAASGASTYVTVCFAFVDMADDGGLRLELVLGGHPAPTLWRDGSCRLVGEHGSLLGLVPPSLTVTSLVLRPGDVMVMYTDGLTDTPEGALDQQQLAALVASVLAHDPPSAVADLVHAEVQHGRPHGNSDDSAVLVVHVLGDRAVDEALVHGAPTRAPSVTTGSATPTATY